MTMFRGSPQIFFQAHRGSTDEAPENTMAGFRHAWRFPGAIPETDVRTTADGQLICLHDVTLARTTNADAGMKDVDVAELTLAQVRQWDAGIRFSSHYTGEAVPTLDEVLTELMAEPHRRLYLEPKAADMSHLESVLVSHRCLERLLFVHKSPAFLAEMQEWFPGAPTMSWISGSPMDIQSKFEALAQTGFVGLSQLQLHLPAIQAEPDIVYAFDNGYLSQVRERLQVADVELQLCPFAFDVASLRPLIDLGVRWFVTDSPERFSSCIDPNEYR